MTLHICTSKMFQRASRLVLFATNEYRTYFCPLSYKHSFVRQSALQGKRTQLTWYMQRSLSGYSSPFYTPTSLCRNLCTQPRDQLYSSLEAVKQHVTVVPVEQWGVKFDLGVVVVGDPTHPVALCSHGVPGGSEDFLNLVPALLDMGLRVVLPTYPGFKLSPLPEKDIFRLTHSTVEKADFLRRVCTHLQINRVDLVIAHSQGTAAAYKFCAEENVEVCCFPFPMWICTSANCSAILDVTDIRSIPQESCLPANFLETPRAPV
ncbi:uncharacterized protein LOC135469124 [Liolophura sinensis]|uniref:uncharacterized protein LOC135469124 n=1 Tax=Liolophura sinensis TaxID=3198878 RepID=UPI003157F3F4